MTVCDSIIRRRILFCGRCRIEQFYHAKFDADLVLEPTCSVESVKDIGSNQKITGKRNLKLQVAPQVVIFTYRLVGQGYGNGCEHSRRRSAAGGDLLATP